MGNYYEILGVSFDASDKEIRNAYGEKIKKYKSSEYPEEYKQIVKAYNTLKNSITRKEYDANLNHGEEIKKYEADAKRALDNEDYKTAIDLYKKILSVVPDLAPIKSMLAIAYFWNGEGDLAIKEIKKAIILDSKNPMYHLDMGAICKSLGDINEAEKSYLKAYKLGENNYNVLKAVIGFYTDNKKYETAVSLLEKCTGKDSDNVFQDFSYLIEMISVYIKSNDASNVNKIKKLVDRIKKITPESKSKDVALKIIDLVEEAYNIKNEKIIKVLCDSVFEFDKDNKQIKEFLKEFKQEQNNQEQERNNQPREQYNSRQEQAKPVYNLNDINIPISNFDQIKTIIIGCITLVICGAIGLELGIGVIFWLFVIVPLVRKYNIDKHNKYNIPQLSLAHKLLGYVIIMGTCIFNVEANIIGGRTEDNRMVWGYILGYAGFCLFMHRFPGLGITKNSGQKIKTKKIELLFEEISDFITGFFKNKSSSFHTSSGAYNNGTDEFDGQEQDIKPEVIYENNRNSQNNGGSDNISTKKVLIVAFIVVSLITAPTIGYIAASKFQDNTQASGKESSENAQISVKDFNVSCSNELQYIGDQAVINIDKIYPSNINKNDIKVYLNSDAPNVISVSDTKLFAVGKGSATITVSIGDIKKNLSFNIKEKTDSSKQNNYLRKESDSTYLSYESLYNLSNEELLFINNEIFARHGYIFTEQPYKAYFNSQNWYNGTKNAVSENELNIYEKSNVDLIHRILESKKLNSNNNSSSNNSTTNSNNSSSSSNNVINTNPTSSEYICKNIDSVYLSRSDLAVLNPEGLAMLRNEVYARHGYIFKEEPYKSFFNNKQWYHGVTDNVPDEMLNPYEFANVKLIQSIEKSNN